MPTVGLAVLAVKSQWASAVRERIVCQCGYVVRMESGRVERCALGQEIAARRDEILGRVAVDLFTHGSDCALIEQVGDDAAEAKFLRFGNLEVLSDVEVGLDKPRSPLHVWSAKGQQSSGRILKR